ncbi:MAG: glutamate--tRNA ligase [Legionellaceae bacterium]|nr:glutamate--tRNA ligase [Legionellaceae bacterium]
MIKTRFAPSPTGALHVGSVRTALFSWLFARHHEGHFILRIEDTDRERSTQASVDAILQGMEWLGLNWEEGPIYQTQRLDRYNAVVDQFLEKGLAYRCNCSKERLESLRARQLEEKQKPRYDGHCRDKHLSKSTEPHVIRFRTPEFGEISFVDAVYGVITVANTELDDVVMVRSDGLPTYNFAVVVDDVDMNVSHVIRGEDHINNTPRQIHLFQALGASLPIFAHLPMILGEDGKKLSKRHGAVNVLDFKKAGYLPEALLNYMVRLGWSHGDQEIFSMAEMIQDFDIAQVSRGAACFDYAKLDWLNQHYMKQTPLERLTPLFKECCLDLAIPVESDLVLQSIVALQLDRCKTLSEMAEKSRYFFEGELFYDAAAVEKFLTMDSAPVLQLLYDKFTQLVDWTAVNIHQILQEVAQELSIGMGKIGMPLRTAITGTGNSPSLDQTVALIGKERVLQRLSVVLAGFVGR